MVESDNGETDPEDHRLQLASLARQKKRRALGFPRDWNPGAVINPASGLPYTESGAWQLIAEILESGHPVETVVMNNPRGKTGYVLIYELSEDTPPLYIKIHFGSSGIVGRSFHHSHH